MRTQVSKAALGLGCALSYLAGCGGEAATSPYRAEVLTLTSYDAATESGRFEIVPRELTHITDLEALSGPDFVMRRGGTLLVREEAGSVVYSGRFEAGARAAPRYKVVDDVAVARDYPTLVMFSATYAFGTLLDSLPALTDLASPEPFEVFFEPKIELEAEGASATLIEKLNAFSMLGTSQFGLAQRSPLERAPLSANVAVLAHELGHWVFSLALAESDTLDCEPSADPGMFPGRWTAEYALRGLNEGFADYVSFALTGVTNSLFDLGKLVGDERSLASRHFTWSDLVQDELEVAKHQANGESEDFNEPTRSCSGGFYCVGTLFARSLYEAFVTLYGGAAAPEVRLAFGREVTAALRGVLPRLKSSDADGLPAASVGVAACEAAEELSPTYDGGVAAAFLGAFLAGMPENTHAALCSGVDANFGRGYVAHCGVQP